MAITGLTIMVGFRLSVVLMQTQTILEKPMTSFAVVMVVLVMGLQLGVAGIVAVAMLTVVMSTTLDPVFFQPSPSGEIDPTVVTNVMEGRVRFMLFDSITAVEITVAAFTVVGHWRVGCVVERGPFYMVF